MSTPGRRLALAALLAGALLPGCGGGSDSDGDGTTAAQQTSAQQPSSSGPVRLEKVGDFDQPVWVTQPPGSDDLYVVEREGAVRIVRGGGGVSTALDITDQVTADGEEQGLLSVAFPPDFQKSHLVYAYYTGNDQDQHVVSFTVAGDGTFEPGSERELLHMADFASNHNGGLLLFGPDGQLYIGTGDGGIADDPRRNGQNLDSLLGKILRIDPSAEQRPYGIPSDNPFVDRQGARPEVCNYGLRNPWRFSFDRDTGSLLIGDVGQNTQEEVDYVPADRVCGNNFGWSAFEGTNRLNQDQTAPNEVPPILTYEHSDGGCSVTGGYVVRDRSLPALFGRYVYGDFCIGDLRSFKPATPQARDDRSLGLNVPSLSSFGQDNEGHIYAVSLEGPVYRLAQ
jgi:glucose/arabinose dehydrogenase